MTNDQSILFGLFGLVFALLLWGRWRYDVVAFCALLAAVSVGVVPNDVAFAGFGHPATVIVALVLVVSRGLTNSGAVDHITRTLIDATRPLGAHIAIMGGIGAALSAFMNNVAALALLMPVDIQTATKAKRSAGAHPDAAFFRHHPRRAGDADRHAAQHHHRQLPRGGSRRPLR